MTTYDLVVLGTGVGLTVIEEAVGRGLRCALVEKDKFGGTCLTRGCIPSKVLTHPADLVREAERAAKVGVSFPRTDLDWGRISARMWNRIAQGEEMDRSLSAVPNLTIYRGTGEFTGDMRMRVKLNDASGYSEEFQGRRFVLATGARSVVPEIPGLEEIGYVTNETFFGEKFPERPWSSLAVIGGGILAAEFGHIFSAMGTKVTIMERGPRILQTEEPETSALAARIFSRHMDLHLNCHVGSVRPGPGGKKILACEDRATGKRTDIEADEILVAAGRRSNADLLDAGKTGVTLDAEGWIETDGFLETAHPGIWAIGDAKGKLLFRHKANADAELCIHNIFMTEHGKAPLDYSAVPWAVFSDPQIGHVGMTEAEAAAAGYDILTALYHYSEVAKGFAMGYEPGDPEDGLVKLVVERSGKILGAHAAGPQAALLVQPFVYLMNSGYACPPPAEKGNRILKQRVACPEAGSVMPIYKSMVIHPSLNEVAAWALGALHKPDKGQTGGPGI